MSLDQYRISYEISPIILVGGIAQDLPGGLLPIISLTDGQTGIVNSGVVTSVPSSNLDDYFAHYVVLPGGTLINNQVAKYPFANQSVAANAIITQPLNVSLQMICPARLANDYNSRLSIMQSLKSSLDEHINQGGVFTVATGSFVYENLLLINLHDITGGETKQRQIVWQWDFEQPLLTLAAAAQAKNSLMSKLAGQTPVVGDPPSYSGANTNINSSQTTAGASTIFQAGNLGGVAFTS